MKVSELNCCLATKENHKKYFDTCLLYTNDKRTEMKRTAIGKLLMKRLLKTEINYTRLDVLQLIMIIENARIIK